MRGNIIASIRNFAELSQAMKIADGVEFRLDLFNSFPQPEKLKISKLSVVTIRRKDDGGGYEGEEERRIDYLAKCSRYVDYVDLENDLSDDIFNLMRCQVIESYHDFKKTPRYEELKDCVESSRGDITKIATMGREKRDVEKIVRLLVEYNNVIAFLMGEKFSFTRILAVFLGSPFIYCYISKPLAKGQYDVLTARKILNSMGLG